MHITILASGSRGDVRPAPGRRMSGASAKGADMAKRAANPKTIDEYIAAFSPEVQEILENIQRTIRRAAPSAHEAISYQIPTFKLNGNLVHFAAFKKHIGLYPPVKGDAKLVKAVSRYAGPKGNLQFPLDQAMPYDLFTSIVKLRVKQNAAKAAAKNKKGR
jgi:uncharacterized protein YdhG (YjbR/CyaY superfamily)